jgi:cell division ATPase FtsA
MNFLSRFQRQQKQTPRAYSLIDVGRDSVKAAVVLKTPGSKEFEVVGYGQAKTGGYDITGGRTEANAITRPVNAALTQAEDNTEATTGHKIVPDDAVFILAGRACIGKAVTARQGRQKPGLPITAKELQSLRNRAEKLARQDLAKELEEGGQWLPLAVTDAGTRIDDHVVLDGVGLTGGEIAFWVFAIAGQAGALRALAVLANRLDLTIAGIVASPHALAAAVPQAEAIILDVGYTGTDICLIKNDALVAADWIPFGGYFFSRALARHMNISQSEADALKLAFARSELEAETAQQIDAHFETLRQRWYTEALEMMTGLAGHKPLPRQIYLTGGGSLLPGLDKWLRSNPEPFISAPEVNWLGRQPLPFIKNSTESLNYDLFALTLSGVVGIPE